MTLAETADRALHRDPTRPAIEFRHQWVTWGALRHVADAMNNAIEASGIAQQAPIGFIVRNRPGLIGCLLGLLARSRTIQMIYAFQSPVAIARNLERLRPAGVIA